MTKRNRSCVTRAALRATRLRVAVRQPLGLRPRGRLPCGTNPTTTRPASASCRFAGLPGAHDCPWPAPPPDARAATGWLQQAPPADLVRPEYRIAPLARLH